MKTSDIRQVQKQLAADQRYSGKIDGKRGPKTDAAITASLSARRIELPAGWETWSSKRKSVAYLQLLCRDKDIDPGKIDGLYGPQTESASDRLKILVDTGVLPRGFGDIEPVRENPHHFPTERYEDLNAFYGEPCEMRLIRVPCPWTLRLDWDLNSTTNTISIHERLADSVAGILQKAYDRYGLEGIRQWGLDRYGGSVACRKKRGSLSAWSTHAWGIAIDWYPSRNKLKWDSEMASLAHPQLDAWWEAWEQDGWVSLGRSENRDWMHVQAAKRG
jgi:hypothetical protein